MKELKDYTTEELKAELKRREKETRKMRQTPKPDYLYWIAKVEGAQEWGEFSQYKYRVSTDDKRIPLDKLKHGFPMISGLCKKVDRPKVGDTIRLRLRYTKDMKKPGGIIWWDDSKICEIIKKA